MPTGLNTISVVYKEIMYLHGGLAAPGQSLCCLVRPPSQEPCKAHNVNAEPNVLGAVVNVSAVCRLLTSSAEARDAVRRHGAQCTSGRAHLTAGPCLTEASRLMILKLRQCRHILWRALTLAGMQHLCRDLHLQRLAENACMLHQKFKLALLLYPSMQRCSAIQLRASVCMLLAHFSEG